MMRPKLVHVLYRATSCAPRVLLLGNALEREQTGVLEQVLLASLELFDESSNRGVVVLELGPQGRALKSELMLELLGANSDGSHLWLMAFLVERLAFRSVRPRV